MKTTTLFLGALSFYLSAVFANAGTIFTYQGRLASGQTAANGLYEMQFSLFDAVTNGNPVGTGITVAPVQVTNGIFTVGLDFGSAAFTGVPRWLEISLTVYGSDQPVTTLHPRQRITSTPYAILADNVSGPIPDSQLSSNIARLNSSATFAGPVTASAFSGNGSGLSNVHALSLEGFGSDDFWRLGGNSGTTAGVNFVGTTDNQPLELKVNGQRAMRIEPTAGAANIIGGFSGNSVQGSVASTISGGGTLDNPNTISAAFSSISGGIANQVVATDYSFIGGGNRNSLYSDSGGLGHNAIIGGEGNAIDWHSAYSFIGGGASNFIDGIHRGGRFCTISGGANNHIRGEHRRGSHNTIGGGFSNLISEGSASTIAGGQGNVIRTVCEWGTIGGGYGNFNSSYAGTISGGYANRLDGDCDFMSAPTYGTIGGGAENVVSFAAGGSTIAGGIRNFVRFTGEIASIGGGFSNRVIEAYGTVPGGAHNTAGKFAFAAGRRAKANDEGSFVWGDSTDSDIVSSRTNQFTARASGGVRFFTDAAATTGAELAPGSGSWSSLSDRNAKTNFTAIAPRDVLQRVASLPIQQWSYKTQDPAVRHVGPTAQDFHAAFGVGEDATRISSVDADGVALAAIQGLHSLLKEKDNEIENLKQRLAAIEALLSASPRQ